MLIKKILAALPLSPAPKRLPKQVEFCAGATVHNAGRCGDVLTVDVYNHKGELLYRFFSDGRNYITYIQRPFSAFASSGWTKRNPPAATIILCPMILPRIPRVSRRWKRYWAVLRTGVAIIARLAALFRCLYTV